jgi:hypothetical protein
MLYENVFYAWAYSCSLQEKILSPKVLHFSKEQVFWTCHKARACESFPDGAGLLEEGRTTLKDLVPGKPLAHYDSPLHMKISYWMRVVDTYSRTKLTFQSDRLIALSGIAREVHRMVQTPYIAGLWQDQLPHTLLWQSHRDPKNVITSEYIAPSWSWASAEQPIRFDHEAHGPESAPVCSCVTLVEIKISLADQEDAFGQVTAGHLRIRGRLGFITWKYETDGKNYFSYSSETRLSSVTLGFSDTVPTYIPKMTDRDFDRLVDLRMDDGSIGLERCCSYLLPIQLPGPKSSIEGFQGWSGLLLAYQPCGRFKRIGMARSWEDPSCDASDSIEHFTECEVTII